MTFVDKDGDEKIIKVPIGMSLLEAAHENDIELEGKYSGHLCEILHPLFLFLSRNVIFFSFIWG